MSPDSVILRSVPDVRRAGDGGLIRKDFPVTTAAVAQARQWATATVAAGGHLSVLPVVALLVSELSSNVLLHAGGDSFSIEITDRSQLEIKVYDESSALPQLHRFTPGDAGGRGLGIVNALADAWGVETRPTGKCVWFRVDTTEQG